MKYYSLKNQSPTVDFKEATIRGQAPDKGLYFPETIPHLDKAFLREIENYENGEIAFRVIQPYVGDSIPGAELERIANETVNFDIPLVSVSENIASLELFHGPTLAFKDVGARFMSRCLGYFVKDRSEKLIVLVATSGDTGGAVANGFYDVDGIEVVILYPSGKVSAVQEKQLTTLGKNIHALEIEGSFDDCQKMVKDAFADQQLNKRIFLTSANSINVARWLPQQFYYFFAWKQWKDKDRPPVIAVPCGNFGNICGGILAHVSGLPVKHFIAACNANDTVPEFFATGNYQPKKPVATISNAMDVGDPSNFVRMMELFHHRSADMKQMVSTYSITDDQTNATIQEVYERCHYLCDPHGAVAYMALQQYIASEPDIQGYFLETAHPVKFFDVVEPVIHTTIPIPVSVQQQLAKEKVSTKMGIDSDGLKEFLLKL